MFAETRYIADSELLNMARLLGTEKLSTDTYQKNKKKRVERFSWLPLQTRHLQAFSKLPPHPILLPSIMIPQIHLHWIWICPLCLTN